MPELAYAFSTEGIKKPGKEYERSWAYHQKIRMRIISQNFQGAGFDVRFLSPLYSYFASSMIVNLHIRILFNHLNNCYHGKTNYIKLVHGSY